MFEESQGGGLEQSEKWWGEIRWGQVALPAPRIRVSSCSKCSEKPWGSFMQERTGADLWWRARRKGGG